MNTLIISILYFSLLLPHYNIHHIMSKPPSSSQSHDILDHYFPFMHGYWPP